MKKFSFITGILFAAMMVVFAACQKEQAPATQDTATASASSEQTQIIGVTGSQGTGVSPSYAGSLAYNYSKKYDDDNQAQYVVFDAETLKKFIGNLQAKYGSTKIYVNFGVYGKGALPQNPKDYGRLTVFFTGNNIPAPLGSRKGDAIDPMDEFLNHGDILP